MWEFIKSLGMLLAFLAIIVSVCYTAQREIVLAIARYRDRKANPERYQQQEDREAWKNGAVIQRP